AGYDDNAGKAGGLSAPVVTAPTLDDKPNASDPAQLGLWTQTGPRDASRVIRSGTDRADGRKEIDWAKLARPLSDGRERKHSGSRDLPDLPTFFASRGILWTDHRNRSGGSFWVIGGSELVPIMDEL